MAKRLVIIPINTLKESIVLYTSTYKVTESRRVTIQPTLDGGASLYNGGYGSTDSSVDVTITHLTDSQLSILRCIFETDGYCALATFDGFYNVHIKSFNIDASSITFNAFILSAYY